MAGRNACRPDVILVGPVHARPSVDVATTALFAAHPELNRQSCQVTQTRPEGSTSAEGSGKKRSPRAGRACTLGDDRGRAEAQTAVRGDVRAEPVAGAQVDDDELARGADHRERTDRIGHGDADRSRPRDPTVDRGDRRETVGPERVGVDDVAAASMGARDAVVARDPVLVEGDSRWRRGLDGRHRGSPREPVSRAADGQAA